MKILNWNEKEITAKIEKRAMNRLHKAGEVVAAKARQKVPIGKDVPQGRGKWSKRESGALKRTIRVVRLYNDPKQNIRVYAGNREGGVFYAHFVEYGTVKMKAKPFMRPALNESKSEIMNIMENG